MVPQATHLICLFRVAAAAGPRHQVPSRGATRYLVLPAAVQVGQRAMFLRIRTVAREVFLVIWRAALVAWPTEPRSLLTVATARVLSGLCRVLAAVAAARLTAPIPLPSPVMVARAEYPEAEAEVVVLG